MIIKSITINNFRSYYGENRFELNEGLTLIIGDNGDGKTTFFEALQWLLNTSVENAKTELMSEMRRMELQVGEQATVSVSMEFVHDGYKMIEKSFVVERTGEDKYTARSFSFRGYETDGSERVQVKGSVLVTRCFDAFIQRYSMFKGESTLNVFDNPENLKMLVDKLSDIHEFDEYVTLTEAFEEKSLKGYEVECRKDNKTERQARDLEKQKNEVTQHIANLRKDIRDAQNSVQLFSTKIEDLERNQEASERYQELKALIQARDEDVRKWKARISTHNFNINLLDRLWILAPFTGVLDEFRKKVSAFSKEKRRQNDDFIAQKAKEQGRKEVLDELSSTLEGGATRLPWYLPDQATMQEMIDDEVCKVCGRKAEKGSDAYEFMVHKLQDYIAHITAKQQAQAAKPEEEVLFVNRNIEDLHSLSIALGGKKAEEVAELTTEIFDTLALVDRFKEELAKAEEKLQEAEDDKARLLIQTEGVTEQQLDLSFHNLKGYFAQRERANTRLAELKAELERYEEKKREIEDQYNKLDPGSSVAKIYQRAHILLRRVADAFKDAKEINLKRFLKEIEYKANYYLAQLNTGDFHGIIRLVRTADNNTEIRLLSANQRLITDPSGSQLTTMYMSVLFAISELTSSKRDENYPLIFDAPTSSFGGMKESGFYNIIDKLDKQCIIVTKDLLTDDGTLDEAKIDKLTCSVYRIKKASGFDATNLATIRTTVTPIK